MQAEAHPRLRAYIHKVIPLYLLALACILCLLICRRPESPLLAAVKYLSRQLDGLRNFVLHAATLIASR